MVFFIGYLGAEAYLIQAFFDIRSKTQGEKNKTQHNSQILDEYQTQSA